MTISHRTSVPLPPRAAMASGALRLSNHLSRALGRGQGTVAGGRVGLALDPGLLGELAAGRRMALVSGTNGKTTTTALLAAAVSGECGPVASNTTGANMPAGHVSALAEAPEAQLAVLEVDEGYLEQLIIETRPRVVVLLNLSRDQLDRISEVRMLAEGWRRALAPSGGAGGSLELPMVVANADDPLVVHAARTAPEVRWVGAGQVWRLDAVGCPACGDQISYASDGTWGCDRCDLARPQPDVWFEEETVVTASGERLPCHLLLPGRFNRANAVVAAVAAVELAETSLEEALGRIERVEQVAGRFSTARRPGGTVRLVLAKNPAGWTAVLDLLDESRSAPAPVVLAVNSRMADGLDTSWLWDVAFERLVDRAAVVTGDRRLDLAVRLRYAGVEHVVVDDPLSALDRGIELALHRSLDRDDGGAPAQPGRALSSPVDCIANYTAFAELRSRL